MTRRPIITEEPIQFPPVSGTQLDRLKRIRDSLGPVIDAERDQQNNLIRRLKE